MSSHLSHIPGGRGKAPFFPLLTSTTCVLGKRKKEKEKEKEEEEEEEKEEEKESVFCC